jgi:hypothetical protein
VAIMAIIEDKSHNLGRYMWGVVGFDNLTYSERLVYYA